MGFLDWARAHGGGYAVGRDLVSLVIAALGAILAGFAIKLGKTQEAISKRQAEITETQFNIQKKANDKRAELRLSVLKHVTLSADGIDIIYKLIVENNGTKTAPDGSWLVEVTKTDGDSIEITPLHPTEVVQRLAFKTEVDSDVIQFTHDLTRKLYPSETSLEAEIKVKRQLLTSARPAIVLPWSAICEDGETSGKLALTNVITSPSAQP
jgi:hypothetical protein